MSVFEPTFRHLRKVLFFCFHLKKTATEAHGMLSSVDGEVALSERTCREWFRRFKSGDFDVKDICLFRPALTAAAIYRKQRSKVVHLIYYCDGLGTLNN